MTQTKVPSGRQFGNGPRVLLAIHCTLAHAGAWQSVARELPQDFTVMAYDLPHHGQNDVLDATTDIQDASVSFALPFMTSPVDLVGHSFGATVALRLALEHPEKVRSLCLIEPVFFAVAKEDDPIGYAQHVETEAPCHAAMQDGDRERAARLFHKEWGDGSQWETLPHQVRRYMIDRIHVVLKQKTSIVDDHARLLAAGRCEELDIPTLLLEGEQSPDIVRTINSGLLKRLPNAQRSVVKGAAHMAPLTHPGIVAGIMVDFLEMTEK
ncbi:MAG: alpha/beta hydrolase [Roseobacter sp.]